MTHAGKNTHIHTESGINGGKAFLFSVPKVCVCVFITGVRAIESDDWQWVSILSECDWMRDTSAAVYLQHTLHFLSAAIWCTDRAIDTFSAIFVSFECNWSFLLHATVYCQQVLQTTAIIGVCVCVCLRVWGRQFYLKYGLFLSLLTLLSLKQRLLKCFSALTL